MDGLEGVCTAVGALVGALEGALVGALEAAVAAAEAGCTEPRDGLETEVGGSEATGVSLPGLTAGTACVWPAGKLCFGPMRWRRKMRSLSW